MGIEIIGKLTQKNNGDFKLVDLEDVDYDGTGKNAKQELEKKIEEAKNSSTPYDDTKIKTDINIIKTDLGTEELTTTNKTVKGAVNEVAAQYNNIAKQTITTEERTKLNSLNNYDDTTVKANIQNVQQQVNNLVLGAVGDGNNAEVVQARGSYATLNDRINNNEAEMQEADKKLNTITSVFKSDKVLVNLPYTKSFEGQTGWLYEMIPIEKKWSEYENVFVAIELSMTNITPITHTGYISIAAKADPKIIVSENLTYITKRTPVTEGEKFIVQFTFSLNKQQCESNPDANNLFIQYGKNDTIGTPTVTIHNIFLGNSNNTDCSDVIEKFNLYGFEETYFNNINYNDLKGKPKINGIQLSENTSFSELKEPVKEVTNEILSDKFKLQDTVLYKNYASKIDVSTINCERIDSGSPTNITRTVSDGIPTFSYSNTSSKCYIYTNNINIPDFNYIGGHTYLVAIKVKVNEFVTSNSTSSAGNLEFSALYPSLHNHNTTTIGKVRYIRNIATVGADTDLISITTIDETKLNNATEKNALILQLNPLTESGCKVNFSIKDIAVIDLTELGVSEAEGEKLFNKYKYSKSNIVESLYNMKVANAKTAEIAKVAESITDINIVDDIEIWGDSLVAQNYGDYIGKILNRSVLTKGYGGKTSTYIRDKFLAEADTNKTIIINVGRNNYQEPDVVIQDIRAMVESIPHNNFLICCPPNGNYGEGIGTTAYDNFKKIEDRLSKQYQANFLNTRDATIQEYDMGNVKLVEPFVQPQINGQVTMTVSNAKFLTTFNENDTAKWGNEFMNKVVIGQSIYAVDTYRIDSYDLANNTLTVTLLENKSGVKPGSTVTNGVDSGELQSIKYLRVLQNADYDCYMKDTTQSTFRIDGIHMSTEGQKCIAKVVARKINSMKI